MKTLIISLVIDQDATRAGQECLHLEVKEDEVSQRSLTGYQVRIAHESRVDPHSQYIAEIDDSYHADTDKRTIAEIDYVIIDPKIQLKIESVGGSAPLRNQQQLLEVNWSAWGNDWVVNIKAAHVLQEPQALPLPDVQLLQLDLQAERKAHKQTLRTLVQLALAADPVVLAPELNKLSALDADTLAKLDAQKLLQLREWLSIAWRHLETYDMEKITGDKQ